MSYQEPTPPQPTPTPADVPLRLSEEIQGNVLAAFNKDHQRFLLLRFGDAQAARAWLGEVAPQVATTKQVEDWNEEFSRRRQEAGGVDPEDMKALWLNVGLTATGLVKLSSNPDQMRNQLAAFPSFVATPRGQAAVLADSGDSDPSHWDFGGPSQPEIDAVLTVAADHPDALERKLDELRELRERNQVEEVFRQEGETLPGDLVGKEHFGFMDGISQPGVGQFHKPDPNNPEFREGKLGERLTPPGEFVIGYEKAPGSPAPEVPSWMRDGSFQVLRRLRQDVPGWNALIQERAQQAGLTAEQLGARFVGRWKSGEPLSLSPDQDQRNVTNAFDYEDDELGHKTPLFGHIRKTYPRTAGQRFTEDSHRIMRRGIPYGKPFKAEDDRAYGEGEDADRGLVFDMYCTDIGNQFEFMQKDWANNRGFPPDQEPPHGPDPVIGTEGTVSLRSTQARQELDWRRFVHTRGGVYAFCPSKSALQQLAAGQV